MDIWTDTEDEDSGKITFTEKSKGSDCGVPSHGNGLYNALPSGIWRQLL